MLEPVPILADVERLRQVAADLDGAAEQLRRQAGELVGAVETSGWRSTAADLCRGRAATLAGDCRLAAARLDDAGQAVRRHAAAVARRRDEAVAVTRRLAGLVAGGSA